VNSKCCGKTNKQYHPRQSGGSDSGGSDSGGDGEERQHAERIIMGVSSISSYAAAGAGLGRQSSCCCCSFQPHVAPFFTTIKHLALSLFFFFFFSKNEWTK
jgi:hypothetical protein